MSTTKHTLLLSILWIFPLITFSQDLKTSSGEYETYTYLEYSISNPIRHGVYSYKEKLDGYAYTISGNYINGARSGQWLWKISTIDYENNSYAYQTSTRTLSITYIDGFPHGKVSYSFSGKERRKDYNGNWKPYRKLNTASLTANFDHGKLSGSFISSDGFSEKITGQFGKDGLPTGTFTTIDLQGYDSPYSATYKNGIIISYSNQSSNDQTLVLAKEYTNGDIDSSSLIDQGFYAKPISPSNSIHDHLRNTVYLDVFRWYKISGDKSYDNKTGEILYNGDLAYMIKKKSYTPLSYIDQYKWANQDMKGGRYEKAIIAYKLVLENSLTNANKILVEDKISECIKLLEGQTN